jgi:hypothetical protein
LLLVAIAVAVIGIAGFALWRGGGTPAETTAAASQTTPSANTPQAKGAEPTPEIVAATEAQAAFGPHKQADLPPIPFADYPPPRPVAVVTAAFQFAAEHPEVASYVPCFCGCGKTMSHKGNTDCFVRSRAQNGDVIEWEPHGIECAVCIDVATRSRQMHASGASVTQIRATVEKEFLPTAPTLMTPTPKPPVAASHDN